MNPIHTLLVEDNEGDICLTMEALGQWQNSNKTSVARDGKEAIDFLEKRGAYENAGIPDLILLDVNLPKKNGHEVLQYIKRSDQLKHIPVIMLSTSSSEKDILQSYENYANCFITKPAELETFFKVVAGIEQFWISIAKLPKK